MKKKDEQIADLRLKQLGVMPSTFHFVNDVAPFNAITIVDENNTWLSARGELTNLLSKYEGTECWHGSSTYLERRLHQRGIHGVALFCGRNKFNRRIGRTIAKGKLAKYLEQERRK